MKKILSAILICLLLLPALAGCGIPSGTPSEPETAFVPKVLTLGAGTYYYLDSSGKLYGWGQNSYFKLGLPLPEQYHSYVPVLLAEDVASAAACADFSVMLKNDGSLWVLGNIATREYDGTPESRCTTQWTQIDSEVTQLCNATYNDTMCAYLKSDGTLMYLGSIYSVPIVPGMSLDAGVDAQKPRVAVTDVERLGTFHTDYLSGVVDPSGAELVIRKIGFWGKDGIYYTALENRDGSFTKEKLADDVKKVSPFCWSGDRFSYINTKDRLIVGGKTAAKNVKDYYNSDMYLKNDGTLWAKGNKSDFGLGLESETISKYMKILDGAEQLFRPSDMMSGLSFFVKKSDGTLVYWSIGSEDSANERTTPTEIKNVSSVAGSYTITVVEADNGKYLFGTDVYSRSFEQKRNRSDSSDAEDYLRIELVDGTPPEFDHIKIAKEDTYTTLTPWETVFSKFAQQSGD